MKHPDEDILNRVARALIDKHVCFLLSEHVGKEYMRQFYVALSKGKSVAEADTIANNSIGRPQERQYEQSVQSKLGSDQAVRHDEFHRLHQQSTADGWTSAD